MTTYTPPRQPPAPRPRWPLAVAMLAAGLVLGAGATAGTMLAAGWEAPVADPGPAATGPDAGPTEAADAAESTGTPEVDPYEVWLERAPNDAPELTRDDALARAQLGCDQDWPPGTTDAILQEVYADHITC